MTTEQTTPPPQHIASPTSAGEVERLDPQVIRLRKYARVANVTVHDVMMEAAVAEWVEPLEAVRSARALRRNPA